MNNAMAVQSQNTRLPSYASGQPQVRSFAQKLADIEANPGGWSIESLHAEAATSRLARGGVSEQIIYRNVQTGETIVRHRLTNAGGNVLEDHFRPMYKPRVGEVK
ncbi:MAG: hypothetical protein NT031_03520 [Planctomycetota bacterium]|nr:hypothetical protein [Planctomycetota bacterium]